MKYIIQMRYAVYDGFMNEYGRLGKTVKNAKTFDTPDQAVQFFLKKGEKKFQYNIAKVSNRLDSKPIPVPWFQVAEKQKLK